MSYRSPGAGDNSHPATARRRPEEHPATFAQTTPKFTMSAKPPKVNELSRNETLSSFLAWKGNLTYNLPLNPHFAQFLEDDVQWQPKSVSRTRGLQNLLDLYAKNSSDSCTESQFLGHNARHDCWVCSCNQ